MSAPEISTQAQATFEFLAPEGTRIWLATLMPDRDTDQAKFKVNITVNAPTEEAALQTISLAALRFRAALAAVEGVLGEPPA